MIKVLDSFVADKIAAGEVIERPVSAVKELIENSIDAGAHSVIIEIRNGGKSYIRVTDDGCGISYDESETAFLRHATSKISGITDLDSIETLGFRGEALASICAVSRLTMVTRTPDSASGTRIILHAGQVISKEITGANPGTTVIVEDLFYNTPARRKFMKSDAREASSVIELIQQYAVCRADIRFMMISSGQTLFHTKGDGDTEAVIRMLYPDIYSRGLIPLSGEDISGFISDPGSTMSTRRGQLFFVNGRLIFSSIIEKGLTEGYQQRIFSGFPAAVLFIKADPSSVDVNIHPGKREIRFLRQEEIRRAISSAVRNAVMTGAGIPKGFVKNVESTEPKSLNNISEQTSIRDFLSRLERPSEKEQTRAAESAYMPQAPESTPAVSESVSTRYSSFGETYHEAAKPAPFDFADLVFKGYVFDTYIIMQGKDELYIFDQHAAHERIFYEKLMRSFSNSSHSPQPVLTAFTINVSPDIYSKDRAWLEDLRAMGYDIEDFGDFTFIVRGIPPYMSAGEAESFASAYSEAAGGAGGTNTVTRDKLILKSCKSAVKANDKLSEYEINDLMLQLSKCDNPYSCPHGRPTFIRVSSYDIERSFRRK